MMVISCFFMSASAQGVSIEDQYNYLLSIGTPESCLNNLIDIEIINLYNDLYGKNYIFNSINMTGDSKSKNMSDEFSDIVPMGYIPDDNLYFRIMTFYSSDEETGRIYDMYVSINYIWEPLKPIVCRQDGIAVNWDSSVFGLQSGSFDSYDIAYCRYAQDWIMHRTQASPNLSEQGGLGYIASLEFREPMSHDEAYQYKGSCAFILLPRSPMYIGINEFMPLNAQYIHNKNPLPGFNVQFIYNGVSVGVDLAGLKDEMTTGTEVYYDR